jgi:hypothetical protein
MEIKILCPKCDWEPDGGPHWECTCGHHWNVFDTGGKCPSCSKIWIETQCPSNIGGCNAWSPHIDWYRNLDDIIREMVEEAFTVKVTI